MSAVAFNDCTPFLIVPVNLDIIEFVPVACATFLNADIIFDRMSFDESDCAADLANDSMRPTDRFSAND